MKKTVFRFLLLLIPLIIIGCSGGSELTESDLFEMKTANLSDNIDAFKAQFNLPNGTKLLSTNLNSTDKIIEIKFSQDFSYLPLREKNVSEIYDEVKRFYGNVFNQYEFKIYSMNYPIEELIPNFYRSKKENYNTDRLPKQKLNDRIPIVKNVSKNIDAKNGLKNKNVLLWHSHGWYYNNKEKRWMWQRARLFQTVEDIGPLTFTIPYLIPMLENAGANVFVPRERDVQLNEVIVDNDNPGKENYIEKSFSETNIWQTFEGKGFALKNSTLKDDENPFTQGTSRFTTSLLNPLATVSWLPDFPEAGEYAVYVSYSSTVESVTDAHYTVIHSGGETEFEVNQKIGGGTWIYLGTFKFDKGKNKSQGVMLSNRSKESGKIVSADAVRFGGGMGIVERDGTTSGRPKFIEGARYWLQFAGMPDTLTYNLNNSSDDYKDDYQCRAEYGNFLYGAPFGPNRNRNVKGLGIPMDLSLAFHTDAGITRNDTVIGTLMIYSIPGMDSLKIFPDSVSRLTNRDLGDIVQTQIVNDTRKIYDSTWTRRNLWNALYSEAARPNFPSILLELFSHQNFTDVKFYHDPSYKFDISRAIYKGMLKFLATQYGYDYVVQPLPVTNFETELTKNGKLVLSWKPQPDTLEPTAVVKEYMVYKSENGSGFDNGIKIADTRFEIEKLKPGVLYRFKVTAVNEGGESFPSEILSACWLNNKKDPVLVINGFDRISGPASFESQSFSGFLNFVDEGVPDKYDYGFTGTQFNFDPSSKWQTDDKPGHGTSASNYETMVIAGNTFDFTSTHGQAIKESGLSFCSVSDESVMDGTVDLNNYEFVDLIQGEEKKTPSPKYSDVVNYQAFPQSLKDKLTNFLDGGGKLLVSGAYIGTDLYSDEDSLGVAFANDVLKFNWKTGHAVKTGDVFSVNNSFYPLKEKLKFNTEFSSNLYKVEAPDEISGINGSEILLRYSENNFSAAVGYSDRYGVVNLGFPFETLVSQEMRNSLMKNILKYLKVN